MYSLLPNAVILAKEYVAKALGPGGRAVDATAGNGHDTLFLARLAGEEGRVYAFDIQQAALDNTLERLRAAGVDKQVKLTLAGHEEMAGYVTEPVDVVMFNLGYLPGGDHGIITRPETTLVAVKEGLTLLKPGGLMTLVVYHGHAGGAEEAREVDEFAAGLTQEEFAVARLSFLNRRQAPHYVIIIEKSR
ncbi:MAG: methyltransferase domain-containing protein [Clostridia bacterium]|nr:methyltransferase domain-containing protein [Clostridia bacterium]